MITKQALFVCFLLLVQWSFAQNSTLFLMPELPQSNFVNPAVQSESKWFIGIPAMASIHAHYYNSVATYNDVFNGASDESWAALSDRLISAGDGVYVLENEYNYTLLFVGFHHQKNYFTFALNESARSLGTLQEEALLLIWNGDSHGDMSNLDPFSFTAQHSREYIFGWSQEFSKRLTIGAHAKMIFGKSHLNATNISGTVNTSPVGNDLIFDVKADVHSTLPVDFVTNAEGHLNDFELKKLAWWDYAFNRQNIGLGLDFGFIYDFDRRTTFSGSLLNVGGIAWKSNPNGLTVDGVYELDKIKNSVGDYMVSVFDSIMNNFDFVSNDENYISRLVPDIYLGASRKMSTHLKMSLGLHTKISSYRWFPAVTASLNTYDYDRVTLALSYTYMDNLPFNVGAGAGVMLGDFQIHAVSDNILNLLKPKDSKLINFRIGFSYVIKEKERTSDCNCYERWEGRKEVPF